MGTVMRSLFAITFVSLFLPSLAVASDYIFTCTTVSISPDDGSKIKIEEIYKVSKGEKTGTYIINNYRLTDGKFVRYKNPWVVRNQTVKVAWTPDDVVFFIPWPSFHNTIDTINRDIIDRTTLELKDSDGKVKNKCTFEKNAKKKLF